MNLGIENIMKKGERWVIAIHALDYDEEGNFIGNRQRELEKYYVKGKIKKKTYLERIDSRERNGFTKKSESSNNFGSGYPEKLPPIFNYTLYGVVY